jgi:hypothetical protein
MSKQDYLFRARIADAGKSLQSFLRLGQWLLENRTQVAVELFIRDFRNGEKFFRAYVREYASLADSCQSGVLSSKNLFGVCSNGSLQAGECFGTTLVIRQICDLLPDD